MKKLRLPLLAILLTGFCFSSCNKKDKKQYSTWYVNGNKFSSNDVEKVIGKAESYIGTQNGVSANGFSIQFSFGRLPTQDSFPLDCGNQNPEYVCFGLTFNGVGYYKTSTLHYLQAGEKNGKAQYTLQAAWFYNAQNPDDSVLIHGVFNEP